MTIKEQSKRKVGKVIWTVFYSPTNFKIAIKMMVDIKDSTKSNLILVFLLAYRQNFHKQQLKFIF